ncbi:paraquat-inducible protein A [Nitrosococcus watsonii]|uniref:Integral membrane protein, PqiA family n=1 Tax=Nitrosococcus watsoni (strain C-113) TaxID=105559 RepID=D8KBC2_NITWC|nr:paraquat-inducible protein A [Nitrosococcus watsonii]ADJ29569.1 integral membrane protein, PqiA family [Nitrosococcus watsonii C-113]
MDFSTQAPLAVCHHCDWVMTLPRLRPGETACCPRCGHKLPGQQHTSIQNQLAWASAALIMLTAAIAFPFVSFEVQGIKHTIIVADTALALFDYDFPFLGLIVLTTTILLPATYLLVLLYLHGVLASGRRPRWAKTLARLLTSIKPWMMSDVFVAGVLVSMIKVLSLANLQFGPAFPAFCAYAVLLLKSIATFDPWTLWKIIGDPADPPVDLAPGNTAATQGAAGCARCGAIVNTTNQARCPRCGRRYIAPDPRQLQTTWALLIAAGILYIPAMVYPIMITTEFGRASPQTVVGGARLLAETGSWPIALVIFIASIVVPIGKVLALGWLCLQAQAGTGRNAYDRLRLYRMVEIIGRWSFLDVFVVALLTALIQAGELMRVQPSPGAVIFAIVVILTMLAAMAFDPRLIWWSHEK